MRILTASFVALLSFVKLATAAEVDSAALNACPGYRATHVRAQGSSFTAELEFAGIACNVIGDDIAKLSLNVVYETGAFSFFCFSGYVLIMDRIYVEITDAANRHYEVPEAVFPPHYLARSQRFNSRNANIQYEYTANPFTQSNVNALAGSPLIFESQYLRLKTTLPTNPNIYGLGEYTNPFRLPPDNTTVTLWNCDTYGVPIGSNLYGDHPVYYEHRTTGTHDVFILNLNGMEKSVHSLEYNVVGDVLDMYFLSGSTSDPTAVTKQYSELTGRPAEVTYWSFGFQQCRFGYKVIMTDSAVALADNYPAYTRGKELDIYLKSANGSGEIGFVWPGVTVYPYWFNPSMQTYLNDHFAEFYSPEKGLDIDGAWIDMNGSANFCVLPCDDPWTQAVEQELPPKRTNLPPKLRREVDITNPPYTINNTAGGALSSETAAVNAKHAYGLLEEAMLNRRLRKRSSIITRSTFPGAGAHAGKWLVDNLSLWEHYRGSVTHNGDTSISQEFYRWPIVVAATKNGLDMQYRLLDYIYTAFYNSENSISVNVYFSKDTFYGFKTLKEVRGKGANVRLDNVSFSEIPVCVRSRAVLPLWAEAGLTTREVSGRDLEILVAPWSDVRASVSLYAEDGESIAVGASTSVSFAYENGKLDVKGTFRYALGVKVKSVKFLGVAKKPSGVKVDGKKVDDPRVVDDKETKVLSVDVGFVFDRGFSVRF
ncbi:glycosyl hydrolases family 31-domain-containing protein [Cyathus striatus]|nr:glycosyl hydrolases family 31-domain-containing protein [Cyathus striatus]